MSSKRGSHRGSRIATIPTTFFLVGVAAWFIGGCSGEPKKATETKTETKSETTDGDVHVKVDLPDTVTIKP
jgi:hypothetical protein